MIFYGIPFWGAVLVCAGGGVWLRKIADGDF